MAMNTRNLVALVTVASLMSPTSVFATALTVQSSGITAGTALSNGTYYGNFDVPSAELAAGLTTGSGISSATVEFDFGPDGNASFTYNHFFLYDTGYRETFSTLTTYTYTDSSYYDYYTYGTTGGSASVSIGSSNTPIGNGTTTYSYQTDTGVSSAIQESSTYIQSSSGPGYIYVSGKPYAVTITTYYYIDEWDYFDTIINHYDGPFSILETITDPTLLVELSSGSTFPFSINAAGNVAMTAATLTLNTSSSAGDSTGPVIPEPGSIALLLSALAGTAAVRRRPRT